MQNHHGGVVLVDGYLYGFNNSILTLPGVRDRQDDVARSQRRQGLAHLRRRPPLPPERRQRRRARRGVAGGYKETGRFKIADKGLPSWAHPVVSGGRLYVRNQDTLAAYDVRGAR